MGFLLATISRRHMTAVAAIGAVPRVASLTRLCGKQAENLAGRSLLPQFPLSLSAIED